MDKGVKKKDTIKSNFPVSICQSPHPSTSNMKYFKEIKCKNNSTLLFPVHEAFLDNKLFYCLSDLDPTDKSNLSFKGDIVPSSWKKDFNGSYRLVYTGNVLKNKLGTILVFVYCSQCDTWDADPVYAHTACVCSERDTDGEPLPMGENHPASKAMEKFHNNKCLALAAHLFLANKHLHDCFVTEYSTAELIDFTGLETTQLQQQQALTIEALREENTQLRKENAELQKKNEGNVFRAAFAHLRSHAALKKKEVENTALVESMKNLEIEKKNVEEEMKKEMKKAEDDHQTTLSMQENFFMSAHQAMDRNDNDQNIINSMQAKFYKLAHLAQYRFAGANVHREVQTEPTTTMASGPTPSNQSTNQAGHSTNQAETEPNRTIDVHANSDGAAETHANAESTGQEVHASSEEVAETANAESIGQDDEPSSANDVVQAETDGQDVQPPELNPFAQIGQLMEREGIGTQFTGSPSLQLGQQQNDGDSTFLPGTMGTKRRSDALSNESGEEKKTKKKAKIRGGKEDEEKS